MWSYSTFAATHIESVKEHVEVVYTNPQLEIIASPNPFTDAISLEITAINCKPAFVKVFDLIGVQREFVNLAPLNNQNIFKVSFKNLPPGVYFCNVYSDSKLLESIKIISVQ